MSPKQWLLGALVGLSLLLSLDATACPLCLARKLSITAQDLVYPERAVLALPIEGGTQFRVIEVIKGEPPADGLIAESVFRADAAAIKSAKPLLLVRKDRWLSWANLGPIAAEHAVWLRQLAATTRSTEMTDAQWREHVAFMVPYLENFEPMVAEIAHNEIAGAPYGAIRSLKPRLDAATVCQWGDDPNLRARYPLYILLLGIAGEAEDAQRLEKQLDAAWKAHDAVGRDFSGGRAACARRRLLNARRRAHPVRL